MTRRRQPALVAAGLAVAGLALLSCGDSTEPPRPQPPPPLPTNATPEGTILRLIGTYTSGDVIEFGRLFTGDYTFEGSTAVDPDLVGTYETVWFREDEIAAAGLLFQGGVNSQGEGVPSAKEISLTFTPVTPTEDDGAGRNPNVYKELLTRVRMTVEFSDGGFCLVGPESSPSHHRFFLVRGDHALGLGDDQPADSLHWYVWNWREEDPPMAPGEPPTVCRWSELKETYR